MLPNFLQSSLKIYKEDTNAVATWLAEKAKQCGYPPDLLDHNEATVSKSLQASKRLKGKARKQAKDAASGQSKKPENLESNSNLPARASYVIKVKDFTTLADHIAGFNKPVVKVPKSLAHTLDRAINLRKQHSAWSREQDVLDGANQYSNQADADVGHSYFLSILERTREILRPRMPSGMVDDFLSKSSGDDQISSQMGNNFANLDIQEPSQAFLDAPNVENTFASPRYEAETLHTLEEQYLAAHCLFEDVSHIRGFIGRLWTDYLNGMGLVAASITTNTAIDFVRSLEEVYLHQFPEKTDYESILEMFYKVQCTCNLELENMRARGYHISATCKSSNQ